MLNVGMRGANLIQRDLQRVTQQGIAYRRYARMPQRGREHQHLAFGIATATDGQHVVAEAHVQHAICLIENQDQQLFEIDPTFLAMLEKASWRCDQYFRLFAQQRALVFVVRPASDGLRRQRRFGNQLATLGQHLPGELPRGHEHQRE